MLHHHALGPARGARGVDHVRRVARARPRSAAPSSGSAAIASRSASRRTTSPSKAGSASGSEPVRHQQRGAGVGQRVRQALGRVGRVQRHVGAAGLEHAQHADHHLRRALQAERHARLRPHAAAAEVVRQLVGGAVQLGVGQRLAARRRRPARPACAPPARENSSCTHAGGCPTGSARDAGQQLRPLARAQQRQLREAPPRLGRDRLQHARPGAPTSRSTASASTRARS